MIRPEGAGKVTVAIRLPGCPAIRVGEREEWFFEGNLPPGPYRVRFEFEVAGEARAVERELPDGFDGEVDLR